MSVPPNGALLIHVVSHDIGSRLIPLIFSAQKEFLDSSRIFKPLVIVHEHEPFPAGRLKAHVSCRGKIVAPCKPKHLVRFLLQPLLLLRGTTGIRENQLAGHPAAQPIQCRHASFHVFLPSRNQNGDAQKNLLRPILPPQILLCKALSKTAAFQIISAIPILAHCFALPNTLPMPFSCFTPI